MTVVESNLPLASRPFMVITTQRTGSSWLMDRINNVPGAQGHMELFHHDTRRSPPRAGCNDYQRFVEVGRQFTSWQRPRAVFAYLDALYARPGVVGFKLMYSQLRRYPEILLYALRNRLPLVHLVRDNHLDVVVSEELARATGTSHATAGDKPQNVPEVDIDPKTIAARIRRLARKQQFMRHLLRVLPNPVHETAYEALCQSSSAFAELCDFLTIEAELENIAGSSLIKRQRAPQRHVVRNYPEIATALERAGYRGLLH